MSIYEQQEIANELILMKNPYDGDDESYELSFINRKKELEDQINSLTNKYENNIEELEYIYFGYHSHYHQTINNLSQQLNEINYNFNPGEKTYIESQILVNKKNLNDQLIDMKEKKLQLEKIYEENVFSIRQEIFNLKIIYEQSLYYQIKKIDDLTMAMKKLSS
jgi:hypothetical protein